MGTVCGSVPPKIAALPAVQPTLGVATVPSLQTVGVVVVQVPAVGAFVVPLVPVQYSLAPCVVTATLNPNAKTQSLIKSVCRVVLEIPDVLCMAFG
jgi:hypothetical protein